jgi:hypothetical protein
MAGPSSAASRPVTALSRERLLPARGAGREEEEPARAREGAGLHPRGVGELLDDALDVFRAHFGACVGIAALFWLPVQVGVELMIRSGASPDAALLWDLAALPVQVLATAFVCGLVGNHLLGERVQAGAAVVLAARRMVGVSAIGIATFMAGVVLLCPCLVTTYLAKWLFSVAPAVYVLEYRGGRGFAEFLAGIPLAIARGIRLVWGSGPFLRWLGWVSVAYAALVPMSSIPQLLRLERTRALMQEWLGIRGGPFEFVLAALSAAFLGVGTGYLAVVMTVYYFDCRVRKEGLDLELRLRALQARRAEVALAS